MAEIKEITIDINGNEYKIKREKTIPAIHTENMNPNGWLYPDTKTKELKTMNETYNFISLDEQLLTLDPLGSYELDEETKDKLHYFDILIHLHSFDKINHLLD